MKKNLISDKWAGLKKRFCKLGNFCVAQWKTLKNLYSLSIEAVKKVPKFLLDGLKRLGRFLFTRIKRLFFWLYARRVGILLLSISLGIVLSPIEPRLKSLWVYRGEWNGEATRSIVLTLGAIGAFYGLMLAARRLDIGYQQAEIAQLNSRNETVSRALQLIASDKSSLRSSGVFLLHMVLEEILATHPEERDVLIGEVTRLFRIMTDALEEWTGYDAVVMNGLELLRLAEPVNLLKRIHIETAVGSITDLTKNRLPSRQCMFSKSDLSYVNFIGSNLTGAEFSYSNLSYCSLPCSLHKANFVETDITAANFKYVSNLTQQQIDQAIYLQTNPPRNLPQGISPKPNRAYEIRNINGHDWMVFVSTRRPIRNLPF